MNLDRNEFTLLGAEQWRHLEQLTYDVSAMDGDVAEIGVYKGGSAIYLCNRFPHTTVHLIDTFIGMPDTASSYDTHRRGDFLASVDEVRSRIPSNGILHKIEYPKDGDPLLGCQLKFLHIDVDLHKSVSDALFLNWPRMLPRGIILIDDYNHQSCRGAQMAVNDFCVSRGIRIHTYTDSWQCYLIK